MTDPRAQPVVVPTATPSASAGSAPRRIRVRGLLPTEPLIMLAYGILRREFDALAALTPQPDSPPSPEDIHQLRVTARRLRIALKLFRRMLPSHDVRRFRTDLRWFARALGDVRDLDVYTDNFRNYAEHVPPEQRQDLGGYELYLRRERADARARLTALFAAPRCAALFTDATNFLVDGPSPGALRRWRSLSVRDGIRDSVRKSVRRVRRLGNRLNPRSTPREFHELRIKAKRLRYELEFFAAIYPSLKAHAKATRALQETLGEHQDACTAGARLRRYAAVLRKQTGGPTPLPTALDELRRGQLRHAREVRQSFPTAWAQFLALIRDALFAVG